MKSALVYLDGFDDELLQPLLIAARSERIDLETRSRRNEVMATAGENRTILSGVRPFPVISVLSV